MKLSDLNMKKINFNDVDKNHPCQNILLKAGELYQFESGIYGYGNLWTKLQRNVENIIVEELDKVGCVEVSFPKLQPKKIWEESGRWDVYTTEGDVMFTLDNNLGEYGLAPTAEECAAVFGANRLTSYKNLPAIYYQIGEKFRKEIRTRGYLYRPRTFTMMDAYSFDKTEEDMKKSYQLIHEAYLNIFERLGIKILPTISDNGTMGGKISEEFQVETEFGEDRILFDEERAIGINKEVLDLENKDEYLEQLGICDLNSLKEYCTLELGNNFQLGTKYSDSMKLYYKDENGNDKPYYMGCYGLGVGRILASMIENNVIKNDDKIKGFSLPYAVAPYKVQIIFNENNREKAMELYYYLINNNVPAIIDDRENLRIGNRINDVYVLGTPKMIVIGNQFDNENYVIEDTKTNDKEVVECSKVLSYFKK